MSWPQFWPRWRALVAELGLQGALVDAFDRLLARSTAGTCRLRCYRVVAQPVQSAAAEGIRTSSPRIRTRLIEPEDTLIADFPRPASVIQQRFAAGGSCLCATYDEQFAGYLWMQRCSYREDEVRCDYIMVDSDRCAWDYDVYVCPERRLGKTFAVLWRDANTMLARQGIGWSMSRIAINNPASLRAHARLGARKIATLHFLSLGSAQLCISTLAPFVHLGLTRDIRAHIRLRAP